MPESPPAASTDREPCPFCGQPSEVELFEVWSPRDFQLATCCEGMHEAAVEYLNEAARRDPRAAASYLRGLGLDALTGLASRRVLDDGSGHLVIDWRLSVREVPWATARAFVATHHRHCPPPAGWRFGAGIYNGADLVGVATVGRPVARGIDAQRVVEVNRVCVRTDLAQGLSWNACSQLYGWAAREARRRGFDKILTYTLASEPGTSLRAAGWVVEHHTRGRSWHTESRARRDKTPLVDKLRWTPAAMLSIPCGRAPSIQRAGGGSPASTDHAGGRARARAPTSLHARDEAPACASSPF